jgi:hypothetical protein
MTKLEVNDVLILKKGHPCGANSWKVIRTGSDVKLECLGCGRVVMIDRPTLLKRIKKVQKES